MPSLINSNGLREVPPEITPSIKLVSVTFTVKFVILLIAFAFKDVALIVKSDFELPPLIAPLIVTDALPESKVVFFVSVTGPVKLTPILFPDKL